MADEENERRVATMDLNLYLGLPRSPRLRSFESGYDLSSSSMPLLVSRESRASEAASVEMEASVSQPPRFPSHAFFIAEADVPSFDPIAPCCLGYDAYGPTCAQETEGPSILYSPSNIQVLQTDQVVAEPAERIGEYDALIDDIFEGQHFIDDNSAQGDYASQTPYSPSYNYPASADYRDDEIFDTLHSLPSSSSQQDLLQCPQFRIPRLIESHGWRQSSLRQSLSRRSERRDHFAPAEIVASESSEKEAEEKNRRATNYFDCNICIDIAKNPVVTPCGHLFCWACLYQWLHVHSDRKECPVCKRRVIEANITPIYGRGRRSRSDIENNDEENINSASGLSIPPRPRGKRLESWSQILNRISERFGQGIADSSSFNPRDLGQSVSIPIAGPRTAAYQASANSSTVAEPNSAYRRTQGSISSGSSDGGGSLGACKRRRLH